MEKRLERSRAKATEDVQQLQAGFGAVQRQATLLAEKAVEAEQQTANAVTKLQETWREHLRASSEERARFMGTQAATCSGAFAQLQDELRAVEELLPDVGRCTTRLDEFRDGLEAGRLRRHETADAVARILEGHVQKLRGAVEQEGNMLITLHDNVAGRVSERIEELREGLKEERCQRQDRHNALAEVVERFRASLEASTEVGEPPPPVSTHNALKGGA